MLITAQPEIQHVHSLLKSYLSARRLMARAIDLQQTFI